MPEIRVNGLVEESIVDGPGLRYVVFTQGCPHSCRGCHNPETHDPGGGYLIDTREILDTFRENPLLSGITFSGGEPFSQAAPLAWLAREVKADGKSVIVFTGYVLESLLRRAATDEAIRELLSLTDMLVDGPYVEDKRDLMLSYRGSANQRILTRDDLLEAMAGREHAA